MYKTLNHTAKVFVQPVDSCFMWVRYDALPKACEVDMKRPARKTQKELNQSCVEKNHTDKDIDFHGKKVRENVYKQYRASLKKNRALGKLLAE